MCIYVSGGGRREEEEEEGGGRDAFKTRTHTQESGGKNGVVKSVKSNVKHIPGHAAFDPQNIMQFGQAGYLQNILFYL